MLVMAGAAAAIPIAPDASARSLTCSETAKRAMPTAASSPDDVAARLLSPLVPGSKLGAWTIERIVPFSEGAVSVVLCDEGGVRFQLDICARDDSTDARRGPARTDRLEIFIANGGNGALDTYEDHGLAAMALAEVMRTNESQTPVELFRTLARRLETEKARVHLA
jgi:hypothetical protein